MSRRSETKVYSTIMDIVFWGALWGIFEATVGYLIHRFSFGYSWLIWYPFACFIMANVYHKTGRISSMFFVGLLSALIKMLNLFLPGSIDRVINPSISILFEALAMTAVVYAINSLFKERGKNPFVKIITAFTMNTGWRLLFVLYLLLFVPDWIRNVSIISSAEKFIPFFITQNLFTSAIISMGYIFKSTMLKPSEIISRRVSNMKRIIPEHVAPIFQTCFSVILLGINIALQFILN